MGFLNKKGNKKMKFKILAITTLVIICYCSLPVFALDNDKYINGYDNVIHINDGTYDYFVYTNIGNNVHIVWGEPMTEENCLWKMYDNTNTLITQDNTCFYLSTSAVDYIESSYNVYNHDTDLIFTKNIDYVNPIPSPTPTPTPPIIDSITEKPLTEYTTTELLLLMTFCTTILTLINSIFRSRGLKQ